MTALVEMIVYLKEHREDVHLFLLGMAYFGLRPAGLKVSKLAMLGLLALAVAIANLPGLTVTHLFLFYGTLRASTLLPTVMTLLGKKLTARGVFVGVIASLCFGAIGFADDMTKIRRKNNKGLSERQKLVAQTLLAAAFAYYCYTHPQVGSSIVIPFLKTEVNLGWFYIPAAVFVIVGTTNSAVAYMVAGKPEVITNAEGDRTTPSLVAVPNRAMAHLPDCVGNWTLPQIIFCKCFEIKYIGCSQRGFLRRIFQRVVYQRELRVYG